MTNQNKARILVADDYEVNRKVTQLLLQKAGYAVDVVADGQQAVEACRQNRYDLILMDIQMPIMDGYEATEIIRKWEGGMRNKIGKKSDLKSKIQNPKSTIKGLPIIAMTGNGPDGSFEEDQYPGMNDCIGKPMQFDLLLSVVEKWLSVKPDLRIKECPAAETGPAVQRSDKKQFPLDMDRAIQEFMGKKEILHGVLHEFINKAKIRIDAIHQAVKRFDYGVIMAEAHGIKGGAANLTADKLANLAADLEKAGEAQQPDLSADLADKLTQEFCDLEKYVQQNPDV